MCLPSYYSSYAVIRECLLVLDPPYFNNVFVSEVAIEQLTYSGAGRVFHVPINYVALQSVLYVSSYLVI